VSLIASLLAGCTGAAPPSSAESRSTPPSRPSLAATPALTNPPTPPPTASPEPLPSDLDPDLVDAIRLRRDYGLRSDLAYVRMVANDPRASDEAYGVPVYPEEVTDAQDRFAESRWVASKVQSYGGLHAQEFGGLYIDEASHAGVVSLWTTDLPMHAATIREWVGPDARVAFLPARYPEYQLRRIQGEVTGDFRADWIAAIPAQMTGVGVDIHVSQVVIDISSANPDAPAIVAAHYDLGDRLRVESDGTGASLIPHGWVDGTVIGLRNASDAWYSLDWESTEPGTCGGGDMGYGMAPDGTFALPCQAGERTIKVIRQEAGDEDGDWEEIGRGTVTVPADARVSLTIEVSDP